jgi:hypothetical protein
VANALSFAHLAGLTGALKAETTDDDKKPGAADPNDDDKSQDRSDGDSKKSKAEGDTDEERREGESDEDFEKRTKKSKADKGDDDKDYADEEDGDEEMRGSGAAAKARRRERERCAAIFGCAAAGKNPVLAANLAFNTSMSRKEALAVLESTPAAVLAGQGRGARNPDLGNGGQVERNSHASTVERMAAKLSQFARR